VTERLSGLVRAEWRRNRSAVMKAAETVSGMSREDIAERIETRPELVPPLTRLLHLAAMTGQTRVLEAMGAVFGSAVAGRAATADCELVLGGLANLHADDVRLLARTRGLWIEHGSARPEVGVRATETLAIDLATTVEAVEYSLVRLCAQGFMRNASGFGGSRYDVTPVGDLLCEALIAVDDVSR
jgi:hypothetical protein